MAKYIINEGYGDELTVEDAERFRLVDGYFWFEDSSDIDIYAISSERVREVKRVREGE